MVTAAAVVGAAAAAVVGAAAAAYSPVWDVELAAWTPQSVATHKNVLQKNQTNVFALVGEKAITGPEGKPFGSVGTIFRSDQSRCVRVTPAGERLFH